jgi:hypothetical protein
MVDPMANFVGQGKPLPSIGAILTNRDNRSIIPPDNPGLTTFEFTISDARAEVKGDRFKVDLAGLCNP